MTYHTDNKIRTYVKGYGFMSSAKNFGSKYGKKFLSKGISASKIIKDSASSFNQSKYDKILKKEANKQLSDKIIPVAIDVAGSKIADQITSSKVSEKKEPQDEEIITPPEKRQQIIDDLRLF